MYLLIKIKKFSLNPPENLPFVFSGCIEFFQTKTMAKSVVLSRLRGPVAFFTWSKYEKEGSGEVLKRFCP